MVLTHIRTVIGMDVGKWFSVCEAQDAQSGLKLKQNRLRNRLEDYTMFVEGLARPIRLVIEATGNWQFIHDSWEHLVDEIQMAHPLKTKAIASARIKTDKIDAHILTDLGRIDMVAQAYIPPREVRDLREILRHRSFLVGLRTKVKNRIHAYLTKLGIETIHTDVFGTKGLVWLRALELREPYRKLIDQDLSVLVKLNEQIKTATKQVDELAKEDPRAAWLLPIRGIGRYSAMLILAEIGEIERFSGPKHLVSFAGLCPSTFQSGNTSYHGRITKQGSKWLRWILVEATQKYASAPGRLGNFYRRLSRRKGVKTARVALAREILTSVYFCLKRQVAFEENPRRDVVKNLIPDTPLPFPRR